MKEKGYLQLRRGIWEHLKDGRLNHMEALSFIYITSQADTRNGVWNGSAGALSGELVIPPSTARRILKSLSDGGYIRRFVIPGSRACYPILVHNFNISEGRASGRRINALESYSKDDISYFPDEQVSGEPFGTASERRISNSESATKASFFAAQNQQVDEVVSGQRRIENREEVLKPKEAAPPPLDLPIWLHEPTWSAFCEMRTKMRAPLTRRAMVLLLEKLGKLLDAGHDAQAVLEQSIVNGWRGVFPINHGGNGNGRSSAEQRSERVKEAIRRGTGVDSRLADALRGELQQGAGGGDRPSLSDRFRGTKTLLPS